MAISPDKFSSVRALLRSGERARALAAGQRLVQSAPRDPAANSLMAEVLLANAQPARALHFAATAAALAPSDVGTLMQHGAILGMADRPDEALKVLERAASLAPQHPGPLSAMAGILFDKNQCTRAERVCRRASELAPGDPGPASQHAAALLNLGRVEEAVGVLESLSASQPQNAMLASGLSLVLNYLPGASRQRQFEQHKRYGELLSRGGVPPLRSWSNTRDSQRRLRVGVVSPDLRAHSVAWFIEPLFEHHNRAEIELFAYQTNFIADAVTKRLSTYAAQWRVMDTATDEQLAQAMRADRIDIAIELSGHTQGHSLGALQSGVAPVQMTYLGYPNTTGVPGIDYRIVDSVTDPPGEADACASEKLLRLDPCFICYKPPAAAPEPAIGVPDRPFTFGSFNNAQKLNRAVIGLWSRVLLACPGSRLVLKSVAFADDELRADVSARFASHGVDPARIDVLSRANSVIDHLGLYARMDIGLDPVPYNGTTTTCEALWMGVPVLTLAGRTHAGRVGASLLGAVGLSELVAGTEDEFVALAAALVSDRARLASLRAGLRPRMQASPLCDGPAFAARFGGALRHVWQQWCGRPAG
ncbi:MAG: hypothetical protein JSR77_09745 [Planctomycetes bacterium]|nr:hypothetical protein [Planctomycetota bacterium]